MEAIPDGAPFAAAERTSTGVEASTADVLLARAAGTADPDEAAALRGEAVLVSMPLARAVARRYLNRGESAEDLIQVAYLALVKAARRYEVGRAPCFDAYATPCVEGELRRWFRDRGWDVRPPRALQELRAEVLTAVEHLTQTRGRTPTLDDVAEHLGLTVSRVREVYLAMQGYSAVSLDAPSSVDGAAELTERLGLVDDSTEDVVQRMSLAPLLARLPERDRHIISLRFYRGWTQEQIAQDVGVTQMQVSRVLKRILDDLRQQLVAEQATSLRAS